MDHLYIALKVAPVTPGAFTFNGSGSPPPMCRSMPSKPQLGHPTSPRACFTASWMPSIFTSREHRMEISPALRGRPATCGCGSALASTERIPVSAAPPSAAPAVLRKSLFFILELLSFCLISFLGAQSLASVSSAREDGVVSKDFVGLGTFFSRYLELCQRCLPAREA